MHFVREILATGCLAAVAMQAQVLFDGTQRTLPAAQGWNYLAVPGTAQQTHTGAGVRLNTLATSAENAGFGRVMSAALDRRRGYSLALRLRLATEAHGRADRAGFSAIVLGEDRRGIELGFWADRVFAQNDEPLFTHGEEGLFPFEDNLTDLAITVRGEDYMVHGNGVPLLSGRLRDYTAFTGFPDVYETANFLFLGDDTTSAAADVEIMRVALITPPVLQIDRNGVVSWTGVEGATYTVETSADLANWSSVQRVTSAEGRFSHALPAGGAGRFVRVVFP